MRNITLIATIVSIVAGASSFAQESQFERELKLLAEQRDKALAAAAEPINRRYQSSLEQLLRRATQGNDLETALKIKKEIEATSGLSAPAPPGMNAATLVKRLTGTKWHFPFPPGNTYLELKANGVLRPGWSQTEFVAAWTVTAEGIVELRPYVDRTRVVYLRLDLGGAKGTITYENQTLATERLPR